VFNGGRLKYFGGILLIYIGQGRRGCAIGLMNGQTEHVEVTLSEFTHSMLVLRLSFK